MVCCVDLEVESFGGDKEEVLDDEEDDVDEEDVVEDVSDSESFSSDALVAFCLNTVGSRTDRPGISNEELWDLLRFCWRVILDSHSILEQVSD